MRKPPSSPEPAWRNSAWMFGGGMVAAGVSCWITGNPVLAVILGVLISGTGFVARPRNPGR